MNNKVRRLGCLAIATFVCAIPMSLGAASASARGTIIKRISGCDYFMVSAPGGYSVLEWYGGHDPDTGDVLVGRIEEYGMHEILDDTADESLTIWTETYGDSRSRALETLVDKCGE